MISVYQIAYKNLLRKKIRTLLTISGVTLSTWVLVSLLGFNRGYEKALNRDIDNMGFQILVTAKGCPYEAATLMLKGGAGLRYIKDDFISNIISHKEVKKITMMLMQVEFDPNKGTSGGMDSYLGVDTEYPVMKSYLKFSKGGWFSNPISNEAVMGYEAAELEQREIGDKILIPGKNAELTVVGILKRTGSQDDGTVFIPLKTLQKIYDKTGFLTAIGIQLKKDADISALEDKIYDLPDVQVISMSQVKDTILSLVATAKMMVLAISIIAILIAMIGVVNTILMSVFERFQEFGILKSMGAMPHDIFSLVLIETVILTSFGGLVGNILAFGLAKGTDLLVRSILPYTPTGSIILISPKLALSGFIIVIATGVVSGFYPAWRASGIRPIESIRGEGF
jgi:putative ABC transport system permease protein